MITVLSLEVGVGRRDAWRGRVLSVTISPTTASFADPTAPPGGQPFSEQPIIERGGKGWGERVGRDM